MTWYIRTDPPPDPLWPHQSALEFVVKAVYLFKTWSFEVARYLWNCLVPYESVLQWLNWVYSNTQADSGREETFDGLLPSWAWCWDNLNVCTCMHVLRSLFTICCHSCMCLDIGGYLTLGVWTTHMVKRLRWDTYTHTDICICIYVYIYIYINIYIYIIQFVVSWWTTEWTTKCPPNGPPNPVIKARHDMITGPIVVQTTSNSLAQYQQHH